MVRRRLYPFYDIVLRIHHAQVNGDLTGAFLCIKSFKLLIPPYPPSQYRV